MAEEAEQVDRALEQLEEWREDQLRRLGIPEDDIDSLVKAGVETHEVARLVKVKKCPVHLVRPILL